MDGNVNRSGLFGGKFMHLMSSLAKCWVSGFDSWIFKNHVCLGMMFMAFLALTTSPKIEPS
jgi:hypothetical protein